MATIVFFLFFLVMQSSCEQTNSLTFLIDNTSSMYTVLSQIKETAKSIVDIVTNVESCQIEDIVLVTFNDPRVEFRKRTRNAFELKQSLDEITVHGGGACPEPSLAGIKLALQESQAGSYLYVFTDASAKDYAMVGEIVSMCQEKKIQIVFIITGLCKSERDPGYLVYHKIAAFCNGQVFRITEGEVREVINYVKETIKGELTVITSQMVESYQSWNYVGFNIDDETKYVMVTAAGKQVFVIIMDRFRSPITEYDRITWTENVKILKLSHLPPGSYIAKVRGSVDVNIKVIGRTDFTFDYGFSDNTTSSLKFTEPQPFTGASSHLIISVHDKENSVVAQMVEILDMGETVIRALPLIDMGGKIYATEVFTPPDNTFKIAVTAKGRSTGNPLRRIAKTPVAPIRAVIVAPEISNSEKYISITEGSPVSIHCRVIKGKPKPQVTWFYKPQRSSTYTLLRGKTDMVLRMTYASLNDTGRYKCVAENAGGQVEHEVQLQVRAFLPLTRVRIASVNRGQNAVIECMISKRHPSLMITWQFKRSDTNIIYNLNTTADVLRIENFQTIDSGYYKCSATSDLGSAQQFLQLIIRVAPQIERFPTNTIKGNESSTVRIDCKITESIPPPTVTWLFKAPDAERYHFLKVNVTSLELRDVRVASNSGHYMCVAENSAGRATQEVELVVEVIPQIESFPTKIIKANQNSTVRIDCKVTKGSPSPNITWLFKAPDADRYQFLKASVTSLELRDVRVGSNSGHYMCVAENSAGRSSQEVELVVEELPVIDINSSIFRVKEGNNAVIQCRITKGTPSPNITWLFKASDADRYQFLKASVTSLELRDVRVGSNSGHYMCVAENSAGRATQEVELVVEVIPQIESFPTKIIKANQNSTVRIDCKVIKGTPSPNITWLFKASDADRYQFLKASVTSLELRDVRVGSNSGHYMCVAENSAGRATQEVELVVEVIPQIESFPTKIIKANQNSTVRIDCKVIKGSPSPNITWLFKAPDADRYQFLKASVTSLELRDVRVGSNSGHYMCVAENSAGRSTQEVELVVEELPVIDINSSIFRVKEGTNVVIQCRITKGTPLPTITWQYKNSESGIFRDIDNTGEILRIKNLQLTNSGFYKCRASNNAGTNQQTVQIIVLVIPQIESFPTKIITVKQNSTVRIDCRVTKGSPSPNIKWLFKAPDADRYQFLKVSVTSLELRDVRVGSNSGHYMCVAENSAGRATQEVELVVEDIPDIIMTPPILTDREGSNVVIQCRIMKGYPPPTVTWQYKKSAMDIFRDINNTGEFLRIPNLQLINSGFYKCRASNDAGPDQQTVQIIVLVMPEIQSFPTKVVTANQSSTVRIDCKVTKGSPSPNITWLYKEPNADRYQFLKASVTSLELRDVRVGSNSGHYMCVAENSAGRATQEVELVVEELTVIDINSSIFRVKEGTNVVIQCRITKGTPLPTITWQYKNSESGIFRDIDNTGEILRIKNLQLINSGFYKCRASNNAGTNQQTVQIIVLVIPQIESFPTKIITVKQNSTVRIDCRVTKGSPSPNIKWLFKAPDADRYQFLKVSVTSLELRDVRVGSNSGHYMCVAENSAGRATQEVELVVEDIPDIIMTPPILTDREGSNVVIQCRIMKGYPPPTVTWQYKKSAMDIFRDINNTGEFLRIPNLQLINSGFYKCRASNDAGPDQQTVQIIVLVMPEIQSFPTKVVTANQSSTVRIDCKVTKGSPSPNITWLYKEPNADRYQFLKASVTSLELRDVRVGSNSGHYMCVAENSAGRATQEVELVVEELTVIDINSSIFRVKEGTNVVIQCRITKGTPLPTITWQYKNSESGIFRDIDNTGEILRIKNLQLTNSGFYKCRASNNAGTNQQTVQIIVLVIPQIESFPTKIITVKQNSTVRIDCRVTKGSPSPNIKWLFKAPDADRYQFLKASVTSLELRDVRVGSNSGHYMCVAENSAGRATQEVELVVEVIPQIESFPTKIIKANQNSTVRIDCKVTKGSPSPNITWLFKAPDADRYQFLKASVTSLELRDVRVGSNSGHYMCVAENSAGRSSQEVELVVEELPVIDINSSIFRVKEGTNVVIQCRITKGTPLPTITWQYKNSESGIFRDIDNTGEILRIKNLQLINSGFYKCRASNNAGTNQQTVQIIVLVIPQIESFPTKIITVKQNSTVRIDCRVTKGSPSPNIKWLFKALDADRYHFLKASVTSLELRDVRVGSNSGHYMCVAENSAGRATQEVELVVEDIPEIIMTPPILTDREGSNVVIQCRIMKGYPPPTVTWQYKKSAMDIFRDINNTGEYLRIPNLQLINSGFYKCRASNDAGPDQQTVQIIVLVIPEIQSFPTKVVTANQSSTVRIDCKVTKGSPSPNITWLYKEPNADRYQFLKASVTSLELRDVRVGSNSGHYMCVAENSAGRATQEVELVVEVIPQIESFPTKIIKANQNSTVRIDCKVTKGSPSPNITWLFKASDADRYQFLKANVTSLELRDVRVASNSGHYMCVAENSAGRATQEVELVVEDIPEIEVNSPMFSEKEGNNVVIKCNIRKGTPLPSVTWQYKNSELDTFRDIDNTGEILRITNLQLNDEGFYKCRASNNAGFAQQTVQVSVLVIPQIEEFPNKIIKAKQSSTVRIDCKVTKGTPSPNITWSFKTSDSERYQFLKTGVTTLELADVKIASNSGHYMCVAENPAGRATQEVELKVEDEPAIKVNSSIISVKEGKDIDILCKITKGTPPLTVKWQYKNSEFVTFRDIDNTGEILRITDLQQKNSGFYKCRASNNVGFAQQTVQVIVLVSPALSKENSHITTKEGSQVTLSCNIIAGHPMPNIKWQFRAKDSINRRDLPDSGDKYIISSTQLENAGFYVCIVENEAGLDEHTIEVTVEAAPQIEMMPSNISAKENSSVRIDCKVTKGFPTPSITWLFKSWKAVSYDVLNYALTPLELINVKVDVSGHYKCVAENSAGSAEQVVELLVEVPPRIVFSSPNEPEYRGVEGDVVMKLSCIAEGHPKPVISWTIDNITIGTDKLEQSYVEDGSLYVKNPMTANSNNTYACSADNDFGHDYQIYEVLVSEYEDYDNPAKMYGEVGKPYEINCSLPFTEPNLVRWFYNSVYLNVTGASIRWESPSQANDGNYTCRVSDLCGAASITVELTFGLPPTPSYGSTEWEVQWDENLDIICVADMDSSGKYEWYYNGEKIEDANEKLLSVFKFGWGNYTCRASNSWGSLNITYNIPSQDCVIDKSLLKEKHMPIILDNSLQWPTFYSNQKFIVVPRSEKLNLVCQVKPPLSKSVQPNGLSNSFKKFPGTRSTVATCDHEDLFLIDGVSYKISELDCMQPVKPSFVNTREQCFGDNTQMIDVGFYVDDFIKAYSSCWDSNRNLLLYTIVTMKGLDKFWKVNEPERPCKQVDDCCYETIELVNAEDVGFGAAESTTLKKQLNSVLYCRPSEDTESADRFSFRQHSTEMPITTTQSQIEPAKTSPSPNAGSTTERRSQEPETSWHDIEREVRSGTVMTVWSGAGNYTRVGGMMVPQYLWKVVKNLDDDKTVAIVHSNAQAPISKLCADDCRSSALPLFEPHGDRTYCCSLTEFKTAFNLDIAF